MARTAPFRSLFIPELDGETYTSPEAADEAAWHAAQAWEDEADGLAEMEAENAWLRAAETNDQYRWEDEQDRLRAAFFSGQYA